MAEIQLSSQLFDDINAAVQRQQPDADPVVIVQYLAAVMGYTVASQQGISIENRESLMDELCGFAQHVYGDVVAGQQQREQAPAGDAFGYWKPAE